MRIKSRISILALTAALLAMPTTAHGQLDLGVDLDLDADEGIGVDAGVDLGVGGTDVNVDAGVDLGGDSLVDADVGVDTNTSGGESSGLDVEAEVLGQDSLIDVDAGLVDANDGAGSADPVLGIRVSALDNTARLEALLGQINAPDLASADLDALIDDTRISIIALADILGTEDAAEVRALVEAGGAGRDELLAAIDASVELGAILERQGLQTEDVVTLSVAADGSTELVVLDLDANIDLAATGDAGANLVETDLADVDIDLLSDEELAEIDLALLPTEQQRVDAVVRLLGDSDDATADTGGDFEVIELDALLGEAALAEVDAVLDANTGEDVLLTADLLGALDEEGLSPEAVIGIDSRAGGPTRIFVDTGLGETGGAVGDLAQLDVTLGTGADDDTGAGTGTDPGTDDGTTGSIGGGQGTDDGTGSGTGTDSPISGGSENPTTNDEAGSGTDDGATVTGDAAAATGANANGLPAGIFDRVTVAEIDCAAGLGILSSQEPPPPSALQRVEALALVTIEGCVATMRQDELAALQGAIATIPELNRAITNADKSVDDLVGGTLEDGELTLYFADDTASA